MSDIAFEHGGKQYTLALNHAPPVWHLALGPTALATFPAVAGESDAALLARVVAWIDEHPDLRGRDQIVLGGG